MPSTRKALATEGKDASDAMTEVRTRRPTGAETAEYIGDMVREMEALARSRGLEQLGALLRLARAEARLSAEGS